MARYKVRFSRPEEELLVEAPSKLAAAEKVMNIYPAAKILQAEPQPNPHEALAMNREPGTKHVIGYMDLVDFECELGAAVGGNRVYPSVEDLKASKKCVSQCGIVEVKVEAVQTVQEGEF